MKTPCYEYQQLLHQAMIIYTSEKEVSGIFDALQINVDDPGLKEGIAHEAEENKTYCQRLEGIIALFDRSRFHNLTDECRTNDFVKDVSIMMKRIMRKHAGFGYHTAIQVAMGLGQNEIATLLRVNAGHVWSESRSLKVIDA